jgi:hypothetical protein
MWEQQAQVNHTKIIAPSGVLTSGQNAGPTLLGLAWIESHRRIEDVCNRD